MPLGVNDRVRVEIDGVPTVGILIDINMSSRKFKIKTETGDYWVSYSEIKEKL